MEAERPVIYAGQGTLYAEASDDLVELGELLQVPVATTLEGKSAFPEDHPLSLGAAGVSLTGRASSGSAMLTCYSASAPA